MHTEIETTIIENNASKQTNTIVTKTKINTPSQVVTGATWIKNTNTALNDYESKLVEQLK